MKTKFKLDKKVKSYLEDAEKLSEEIRGIRLITSEYLLVSVLEDYNSILRLFMEKEFYVAEGFAVEFKLSWIYNTELIENFYEKKDVKVKYSKEVLKILNYAQELAKKKGKKEIDEEALTVALVQNDNPIWQIIFEIDGVDLSEIEEYFSEERYLSTKAKKEKIPEEILQKQQEQQAKQDMSVIVPVILQTEENIASDEVDKKDSEFTEEEKAICDGMFELLNTKFNKKEQNVILGRDKEIEKIFTILQKMTTKNVILTGKAGVGKTAIVEGIAEKIVKGKCPKEFSNKKVISLDLNGLMENTKYVGETEKRFNILKKYLEKNEDVILFIDEIHNIMGLGRVRDSAYDFSNALKPILTNGKVRVIGATTKKEYEKYIKKDSALARRFELVDVEEPKAKDLYKMLKGKMHQLEEYHNVKVKADIFETVVSEASGYNFNVANPARTVDLLDTSMVIAKNHNKEELDIQSILEVHKENIAKFKKMNKEDLKQIAYHEAGHFVLYKALNSKWKTVTLVSIIPAADYLGVNVFEKTEGHTIKNRKEYINEIAEFLAGDIAITLKGYPKNSGKAIDIQSATEHARMMVLQYGMGKENSETLLGNLNSYSREEQIELEYLSDSQKEELAKQTDEILEEAYKKAEEILKKEEKRLDVIAKALMKKGSLTKKELDGLYSKKYQIKDLTKSNIELIK